MPDSNPSEPLGRATVDAVALVARYPPRLSHPNKRAIYEMACGAGTRHAGAITVSRWPEAPLPDDARWASASTRLELREDAFTYGPPTGDGTSAVVEWHLNFAHTILFVAYGGPLFAQDEMQVAEHPALGSVREWLTSEPVPGLRPVTREGGQATPVLLRGVERRCAVATDADLDEGRPYGLYGAAFGRAKVEAVRRATRVLDPPTVTNLVAMEAPSGATGRYTKAHIIDVLATAYTGFRAARIESASVAGPEAAVVVHTGHWGTGAYGGNRVLMAMVQLLAAKAASIDRLVFHTYDAAGAAPCREAAARLEALAASGATVDEVLAAIEREGFEWGTSDGN
ncbi:MAG: hypothetical protein Q8S73_42300 [Deltaproteobacteria bacterium]|nr:hypothetical protein [Myxococcales bacterium]MDP3220793.1 hypothetical protein [Deltaproteobacteria bacterium]